MFSEGVQQPYKISTAVGIEKANKIKLLLSAYPNPTSDYLILNIADFVKTRHDFSQTHLSFEFYDMKGKLLQSKQLTETETQINIRNLVSATYFIKITEETLNASSLQELKTFKIIKN